MAVNAVNLRATQFGLAAGTPIAAFTRSKMALGWGTSRGVRALDGAIATTASGSYSLPVSPANLYIGNSYAASETLNGTLESIAYYRGARSDAFVQAVSR